MKSVFTDSEICKNMKLGRTKVESLVTGVLGPFSLENILNLVKNKDGKVHLPFSIATDASNKGATKFFPTAIRFFDVENEESPIVDALIDFRTEWGEKSDEILEILMNAMNNVGREIGYLTS